jgi:hypothetical protein
VTDFSDKYLFYLVSRAMATSCFTPNSHLSSQSKHSEWMKNLPANLHNEPITKIAIPGTHDSFAFHLTRQAGPDLDQNLRRISFLIHPILRNWSITQNKTFTGIEISLKNFPFFFKFYLNRTIVYGYSLF